MLRSPFHRLLVRLALMGALGIGALTVLVGRTFQEGQRAMAESDVAFDRGDVELSLEHARLAATWYVPYAPHVDSAIARLRAIAVGAEVRGETQLALAAWSALRGAAFETAHPWPLEEAGWRQAVDQANQSIPRLLFGALEDSQRTAAEQQRLEAAYAKRLLPETRLLLATSLGMLLILVAIILLRFREPIARVGVVALSVLGVCFWAFAALGA